MKGDRIRTGSFGPYSKSADNFEIILLIPAPMLKLGGSNFHVFLHVPEGSSLYINLCT
jgi:hypothetical protein